MASDNETKEQFCERVGHDFQPEVKEQQFVGMRCSNCDAFITAKELQALLDARGRGQKYDS